MSGNVDNDEAFLERMVDRLAALPGIQAVALGGSRAQGMHRSDSDWDVAIYYRKTFEPQTLRDVGWQGEVFGLGEWGGGVFNGGAWLQIEGRRVDVHYRDLDVVEHELAEAREGRFRIEPLLFHLAGIPSYLIVAELALCQVLRGTLPRPTTYPEPLRQSAPRAWWARAEPTFWYALSAHARHGRWTQCVGMVAVAASYAAHAVLAARGEWVTNEKTLLTRAGLSGVDDILAQVGQDPERLKVAVEQSRDLCSAAVRLATSQGA